MSDDRLRIAIACDDAYAMPAGVFLSSLVRRTNSALDIYVIDGGLRRANRLRLESCAGGLARIHYLTPDRKALQGAPVFGHVSLATYYRLLLPNLLPDNVNRIIYLDVDAVCLADIRGLWKTPMGEADLLAVDVAGSSILESIPAASDLGIRRDMCCFNAGVLLLSMAGWREHGWATWIMTYLRQHSAEIRFWDQDGLNACFGETRGQLDSRWNWRIDSSQLDQVNTFDLAVLRSQAYLVHFASALKPWDFYCEHPSAELWYDELEYTPWHGWRPRVPWRAWRNHHYLKYRLVQALRGPSHPRRLLWQES